MHIVSSLGYARRILLSSNPPRGRLRTLSDGGGKGSAPRTDSNAITRYYPLEWAILVESAFLLMFMLAERVGFEPTCRLPDNTLSRRARYDHFGTSPLASTAQLTFDYIARPI